jgi:hypothetical protein
METKHAVCNFGLQRFFEPTNDVRRQLRELFHHAKTVVAREREINLEVVLLIAALEAQNAAVNLAMWGGKKELAEALGLTVNQYLKRAQAGRVLWRYPEFIDLIVTGKTHVSHVGTIAPKITEANKDIFLQEIAGKTERDIRTLVASVNRDGSRNRDDEMTFDLKLILTKSQLATLERAKEVLSATGALPTDEDVIAKALEDLLDKRDPLRKAERAVKRSEKKRQALDGEGHSVPNELRKTEGVLQTFTTHSIPNVPGLVKAPTLTPHSVPNARRPIPAEVKHVVTLKDQGCCSFLLKNGDRCGSRFGIQYDHIKPVAYGGSNVEENIRLLCREHNMIAAVCELGTETLARYMI